MRMRRRWLPRLLVGLPLLGAAAFWGGIVVTDHLEEDNTFCTACHLHEKKFTEFHPVESKRITLAAAHNLAGEQNVKCIDCHIGATVTDKMLIKALAARDTVAYFVGAFQGTHPPALCPGDTDVPQVSSHGRPEPRTRKCLSQRRASHEPPHHLL